MDLDVKPLTQHWRDVGFISWPYEPDLVARRLPAGLELELIDGDAWVSIVAQRVDTDPAPKGMLQVNLRTYVTGPDGGRGTWLFSSHVNRRRLAQAVRAIYLQPYLSADIAVDGEDEGRAWRLDRVAPEAAAAELDLRVREWLPGGARTVLDRFLTERFAVYSSVGGVLLRTDVEHESWPLRRASAPRVEQTLTRAAHLPMPTRKPVAHWSEGVDVRIGIPIPIGNAA